MDRFLGHITNRIDAKGRVSVPAPFRSIILASGHTELYALRSLHLPALETGGPELLTRFDKSLEGADPFTQGADDMSFYLHADGTFLKLDADGRITMTDFIREHTGITSEVTFAGANTHFQIWQPEQFEAHRARVRQRLAERRLNMEREA
ncbi:division/cell wall cluster transcriptional repressor MraZ [Phyllobacterium sp. 21LDTY02-6]|uniref:division/cell wall cluster transcriptional repressor MraZ n=1 Tax=unclassified Phyllobacterium TaxID=2638441 RepID=UPI002020CB5A|nr:MULTISPECIES: division/cell wall cluster transcriptional repressor MraZ [unclassified Phyllobacterium]MCO4315965.1 division/cell wall cluster transcriptional repressor MraZ [Phyllobacterium sp. 21LDTY02-6]MCX8279611.1 division/cell wall cluster transcriptional repressor MraZ [Phyllobacterium sp. 0TCS1.6C]MCX8292198.1 division/cell wall cluster transcriptional repressor MraZ [Phyllobacterium sp. 0TCS1.6A]